MVMIEELYDALVEAGASEEKARGAARALADYQDRFTRIDQGVAAMDAKIDRKFAEHDGRFTLLQWMLVFNLAVSMVILMLLYNVLSRLP